MCVLSAPDRYARYEDTSTYQQRARARASAYCFDTYYLSLRTLKHIHLLVLRSEIVSENTSIECPRELNFILRNIIRTRAIRHRRRARSL